MKGTIACGHPLTAKAAKQMLEQGGNAFDAAVAASIASAITEPMLTTLAGGGISILRFPDGETKCIDFLTDFPRNAVNPSFKPEKAYAVFLDAKQEFFLGYASLGVPGTLQGLLHIHKKYGSLELKKVVAPAISYARNGVKLLPAQAYLCSVLTAFCTYTKEAAEIFAPKGKLLQEGEIMYNPNTANFLEMLGNDQKAAMSFYYEKIKETLEGKKSVLSVDDVKRYKVKEQDPISIDYRDYTLNLASPPSAGGLLIAYMLKFIENKNISSLKHNSVEHINTIADTLNKCSAIRTKEFFKNLFYKKNFWKTFLQSDNIVGSTTQISIIDKQGNAIGLTNSNAEGSGIIVKDTGIMINNFAAEPDLMQYRDLYKPGERITSMMAPAIITKNKELTAVLGTGGSNRIRSAMLQTISNMIDFKMPPQKAIDATRVHVEDGLLHMEPGISKEDQNQLSKKHKLKQWRRKDYYFGGVHIATPKQSAGDHRRDGISINL